MYVKKKKHLSGKRFSCFAVILELIGPVSESTAEFECHVSCDVLVKANTFKQFFPRKKLDLSTSKSLSSCYKLEHGIAVIPIIDEIQNLNFIKLA